MARWHNCPNLAAFWCNAISAVLYCYAVYTASCRYSYWRHNFYNERYGLQWNYSFLLIYFYAILASCLLWVAMLYAAIFKTGHLSNDFANVQSSALILEHDVRSKSYKEVTKRIISRIKYHTRPFGSLLHLIGAYCLLIPLSLLINEKVQHGLISKTAKLGELVSPLLPELTNFVLAACIMTVRSPPVLVRLCRGLSIVCSGYAFLAQVSMLMGLLSLFISAAAAADPAAASAFRCCPLLHVSGFCCVLINLGLLHEAARVVFLHHFFIHPSSSSFSWGSKIERYSPLLFAITLLIFYASIQSLILAASGLTSPIHWLSASVATIHGLVWLSIWVLITCKTDWRFMVSRESVSVTLCGTQGVPLPVAAETNKTGPGSSTLDGGTMGGTIYTCFQPGPPVLMSGAASHSSGGSDSRTTSSSGGGGRGHSGSGSASGGGLQRLMPMDLLESNYEDISQAAAVAVSRPGTILGYHQPAPAPASIRQHLNNISEEAAYHAAYSPRYASETPTALINVSPDAHIDYFRSPNVSMRSSNIHSSDSGIGATVKDAAAYISTGTGMPEYAKIHPSHSRAHNDSDEMQEDNIFNICSDV